MIDFSKIELNAVQSVFPHATTYICEFHREQAWPRWIRSGVFVHAGNNCEHCDKEFIH